MVCSRIRTGYLPLALVVLALISPVNPAAFAASDLQNTIERNYKSRTTRDKEQINALLRAAISNDRAARRRAVSDLELLYSDSWPLLEGLMRLLERSRFVGLRTEAQINVLYLLNRLDESVWKAKWAQQALSALKALPQAGWGPQQTREYRRLQRALTSRTAQSAEAIFGTLVERSEKGSGNTDIDIFLCNDIVRDFRAKVDVSALSRDLAQLKFGRVRMREGTNVGEQFLDKGIIVYADRNHPELTDARRLKSYWEEKFPGTEVIIGPNSGGSSFWYLSLFVCGT